jgi:hypothetical protein
MITPIDDNCDSGLISLLDFAFTAEKQKPFYIWMPPKYSSPLSAGLPNGDTVYVNPSPPPTSRGITGN